MATRPIERKQAERQRKQAAGLVRVTVDEWVPKERESEYRGYMDVMKGLAYKMRAPSGPYIVGATFETTLRYDPSYGDDKVCVCGHTYYRHFDSYEDMYPIGCKYCDCYKFVEKQE